MKTVLCYGDSNTWGYNALTEARYPYRAALDHGSRARTRLRLPDHPRGSERTDYRVARSG